MNRMKFGIVVAINAILLVGIISCSALKDVKNALTNLGRLKFKIENVSNMSIAGVSVSDKRSLNELTATDILKLTSAFATKRFPTEFTLNVFTQNPNDGKNGTQKTNAVIKSIDYILYLDDVKTISGDINNDFVVPSTGESTILPLVMRLDLYEFLGNRGYESIVNLAMAIGGVKGTASKVKLDIRPTVSTTIGPITYPGRITVVNHEWR